MFTCCLDVCLVRELDILFLEVYTELLVHLRADCMFIQSTEYLSVFSLQCRTPE
jgi:hypothetical protein